MRIGLVGTLATPVAREGSGSVEHLVWLLADRFVRAGHMVTVFATAGSHVPAELVATLPGPYGRAGAPADWHLCEITNVARAVAESSRFDILHSHAYLFGVPLQRSCAVPMVHTLHVLPFDSDQSLLRLFPGSIVTAVSRYQWAWSSEVRPATTIHHGVDPVDFPFRVDAGDYLCYLGRLLPDKGIVEAVWAAREAGLPLWIAGPRTDFFTERVEPLLGPDDHYLGTVTGRGRAELLAGARALLYPLRNPEPFGLVMVEAMMCGTPVVAPALGAVPEIVDQGTTGVLVDDLMELPAAIEKAVRIPRGPIRACAEVRFSADRMASDYLDLYRGMLGIPDG